MAWAIWLTGLPGSGKTTIANELKVQLSKKGIDVEIVGIDEVRKKFNLFDYGPAGREKAYSKLLEEAQALVNSGKNLIIDATGNKRKFREDARFRIKNFHEIYVKCPIRTAMEREFARDEKKAYLIYKQKKYVPGIHVNYEEPLKPDLVIESDKITPEKAVKLIISHLS